MTNFTNDIRRDLLAHIPKTRAGAASALAALLATGAARAGDGFEMVSENERVAEYFMRLAEYFDARPEVREATRDPKRKRDRLVIFCGGEGARRILFETARVHGRLLEGDEAALSYLRAALIGGGSCTLPHGGAATGYHLECVFFTPERAEEFCSLLARFELFGKVVRRGETYVAYIKSREAISDVLSVLGAEGALKKFNAVSAAREQSNNENRIQNCMAGNADKAAIASAAQTLALQKLRDGGELNDLPRPLREAAQARLSHPTLSLSELAALLGVSKSGLNHRMRKLMQIYGEKYQ